VGQVDESGEERALSFSEIGRSLRVKAEIEVMEGDALRVERIWEPL
jgi:hypothetical protein